MAGQTSLPVIRLRLPCADLSSFRQEVKTLTARGLFVGSARTRPAGTRVLLLLDVPGTGGIVTADAVVESRAGSARAGLFLRVLALGSEPGQAVPLPAGLLGGNALEVASLAPAQPLTGELLFEVSSAGRRSDVSQPPGSRASGSVRSISPEKARREGQLAPFEELGSYQVLRRLGGGGMADVYLARSAFGEGVDKLVALKTVLPEFGLETSAGAMFLTEAKLSTTLQHPNVMQVFDFGEAVGRPYLAMEYVHGRDLVHLLRHHRKLGRLVPVELALAIALEVAKALEYVHGKKDLDGQPLHLVHRDVNPPNVLVSLQGEVKLMDFGVAAARGHGTTKQGLLVGKVPYMSREQARGLKPAPGWDVFALGVMLFELLTGKRPYSEEQLLAPEAPRELARPSWANPEVPPRLDSAVTAAIDLDPARRIASAAALHAALEEARAQLPPCDIGAAFRSTFGEALAQEEAENERLIAEARRRSRSRVPAALRPLVRAWVSARRRVAATALGRAAARNPWAMRGVVAVFVLAGAGGGGLALHLAAEERALREDLAAAQVRALAGDLVGGGGDRALDHLLRAQQRRPGEPRLRRRLVALATRLEELGDGALARGDEAEAAAHLQAALVADPGRPSAREKLGKAEEAIRARSRGRVAREAAPR